MAHRNDLPARLPSEQVVVSAPMSFAGSAARAWRLTERSDGWVHGVVVTGVVVLITVWWTAILCWYLVFGILLVPYRLVRRGGRKRKIERARHTETLSAFYRPAQGYAPPEYPSAPAGPAIRPPDDDPGMLR